jgi:predicted RNA-binding Zn ribbon-like protein
MANRSEKKAPDSSPEELCVRFVNTVSWRLRDANEERLPTPSALLHWLGENGLETSQYWARVASSWTHDDRKAADFYETALSLREVIYGLLHAQAEVRPPYGGDVAVLNAWLARPALGVELVPHHDELGWRASFPDADPIDLLRPIALSAANLITGPRAHKIRQCADDRGCGWLFVDESRAQNRRWCSMGDCGNRAKAARHRIRKKQSLNSRPL